MSLGVERVLAAQTGRKRTHSLVSRKCLHLSRGKYTIFGPKIPRKYPKLGEFYDEFYDFNFSRFRVQDGQKKEFSALSPVFQSAIKIGMGVSRPRIFLWRLLDFRQLFGFSRCPQKGRRGILEERLTNLLF